MRGTSDRIPAFDRSFFGSGQTFSRIGGGGLGGKAEGLLRIDETLRELGARDSFARVRLNIPRVVVLGTDVFGAFMERNGLEPDSLSLRSDERIAHAFQQGDLPTEVLGDLRGLIEQVHTPLAVRSSSLLEDALRRPFAGVYETKMIPNNQPDAGTRFQRLVEAIKLVYASTYFRAARSYRTATADTDTQERMAVIIQEVVGQRHGPRYYPHLSAVARSYSYYPTKRARPDQGVVSLALGLGKTIVDGGVCWSYCPAFPKAPPPFASPRQILEETQTKFWAVNMGPAPPYDPIAETEYLVEGDLGDAEYDGTLGKLVSTYDAAGDRLLPGMGSSGPRALDFSPLLTLGLIPLNDWILELMRACETALGAEDEIEMAATLPDSWDGPVRLAFLQVRLMVAPEEAVEILPEELSSPGAVVTSLRAMGNGRIEGIRDVVYTRPESFDAKYTRAMALEIEQLNRRLVAEGRRYLLIGLGRWGSSDPWLGIPVTWGQVSGAKVIVEATLPSMNVEPSQGSHFFHNLSSFQVSYFTVHHAGEGARIAWEWLDRQEPVVETSYLRHVRLPTPLVVKVDGRTGRGLIVNPPNGLEERPDRGRE